MLIALLHAQGPGLGFPREPLGTVSWLKELYVQPRFMSTAPISSKKLLWDVLYGSHLLACTCLELFTAHERANRLTLTVVVFNCFQLSFKRYLKHD